MAFAYVIFLFYLCEKLLISYNSNDYFITKIFVTKIFVIDMVGYNNKRSSSWLRFLIFP